MKSPNITVIPMQYIGVTCREQFIDIKDIGRKRVNRLASN